MSTSTLHQRRLRAVGTLAALALLATGISACSEAGGDTPQSGKGGQSGSNGDPDDAVRVVVSSNVGPKKQVSVDKVVRVEAKHGTISKVVLRASDGATIAGELIAEDSTWQATQLLEPGTAYTVRTVTQNSAGETRRTTRKFATQDLTLDQQTYAAVAPLEGETVGVGMPVVVNFDIAVTDRAAFEKKMTVTSTPTQRGSWHWMNDNEVHYRPAKYWEPGTEVVVDVDVNGVPAGEGIYGQDSRTVSFDVGDSVISKVNAQTHQMQTFVNDKLVKTLPITTGKAGFTTRSGVKVVMEKFRTKRMNSETVGIPQNSAEAYDIGNVEYAMRVTSSGEFVHAAPWSVGSQGSANVSHGCTGLSTTDAGWLYNLSKRGDVIEYTGTDRSMTLDNGYGDWNESFSTYKAGSAL